MVMDYMLYNSQTKDSLNEKSGHVVRYQWRCEYNDKDNLKCHRKSRYWALYAG